MGPVIAIVLMAFVSLYAWGTFRVAKREQDRRRDGADRGAGSDTGLPR